MSPIFLSADCSAESARHDAIPMFAALIFVFKERRLVFHDPAFLSRVPQAPFSMLILFGNKMFHFKIPLEFRSTAAFPLTIFGLWNRLNRDFIYATQPAVRP